MKKIITLTILAAIASLSALHAFDLKGALKGLGKDGNTTIDGLANVIGDVLSTDKIDVASISGTWSYKEPAVSFKSDNLLKKAGGAAAATAIAEKLAPVELHLQVSGCRQEPRRRQRLRGQKHRQFDKAHLRHHKTCGYNRQSQQGNRQQHA